MTVSQPQSNFSFTFVSGAIFKLFPLPLLSGARNDIGFMGSNLPEAML